MKSSRSKKDGPRVGASLSGLESALEASDELNQAILDSLKDHIAVLDEQGKIVSVNPAWMRFARANGAKPVDCLRPGASYVAECARAAEEGDEAAQKVLVGLRSVLEGGATLFEQEYPCHSPTEERWFHVAVMRLQRKRGGAVVAHSDVTDRKRAENRLQQALGEVKRLEKKLKEENVYLQEEIKTDHDFEGIVGNSEPLQSMLRMVKHVATTDARVLILGETGTGKELIARAIHGQGPRKDRPLVKVNCAALPSGLIASELFGHERGAFTGASTTRIGRFEIADKGTIFLDEVGDLPLDLQSSILRFLQEGEFQRVGCSRTRKADVRVIAATNRNLEEAMRAGRFRQDLYYRLRVFPVEVPPLRDRKEDVPLLVWQFITRNQKTLGKNIEKVPEEIMELLQAYEWPGNVRELEHVIQRAMILSPESTLVLTEAFRGAGSHKEVASDSFSLKEVERAHILRVMNQCAWKLKGNGNAADRLGLHPSTLRSRMDKLGIQRPSIDS